MKERIETGLKFVKTVGFKLGFLRREGIMKIKSVSDQRLAVFICELLNDASKRLADAKRISSMR